MAILVKNLHMSFVPTSSKCQEIENKKAQMKFDFLSKDNTKYNPIFVASCRKRLETFNSIKAFQHATKEKKND